MTLSAAGWPVTVRGHVSIASPDSQGCSFEGVGPTTGQEEITSISIMQVAVERVCDIFTRVHKKTSIGCYGQRCLKYRKTRKP